jgi:excisionase family DNA binding protein
MSTVMGDVMSKRLLRIDEAAHMLNVSRWTVYRWVGEGHLRGVRIGRGGLRVWGESVAALIHKTVEPKSPIRSAGHRLAGSEMRQEAPFFF